MPGHLSTRIFTAATQGVVRNIAPKIAKAATTAAQLAGLALLAGILLIGIHLAQAPILKPVAITLVLLPCLFSLLVVAEQIRITYARPRDVVYPEVEVFPDREPT